MQSSALPKWPSLAVALVLASPVVAQTTPTVAQFLGPASPYLLASAKKADRIAWMGYERGTRNVYTAGAPNFRPVRLTNWMTDDGADLTDVTVSEDGSTIVFVRGSAPNPQGWIANPMHDPEGAERAIWAVRSTGGAPWRVAVGGAPVLSPDGSRVLYLRDGQIYAARVSPTAVRDSVQLGLKPLIKEWGKQSSPRWSPDGSKIAFVSDRDNHSLIAVYDLRSRAVTYLSPGVDCDGAPTWSPDGKRIAYLKEPGVPFARQGALVPGSGNTSGSGPGATIARDGSPVGKCVFLAAGAPPLPDSARALRAPGFYDATLTGGYRLAIMVADVSKCTHLADGCPARELWHSAPGDPVFSHIYQITWPADHLVFPLSPVTDEWDRYYAISVANPEPQPILLTTTNGLIEGPVSAAFSRDGKTLFYCTNANDIERRHIWAVPTSGGTPVQVSTGAIETAPQPLASGKQVAVLYYDVAQPASVALVPVSGGKGKIIFPTLSRDFPVAAHVTPQIVIVKAPDSLEIHNQLFLPRDLKPGERRPAIVYVHGGPMRQMMPGYHYSRSYHWGYAINQWLVSQGYIVLSVNYRSGIGYGRSFRFPPNTNLRGNSEYQDVLAGAKYLQTRTDVDPKRIGIWGLSYGGLLTAQALARNSDVFVAGVDLAGVHLYGNALDSSALSFRSSAVGSIDAWKSPVFLVAGDDDRNVDFSQTVGLVPLLRARNVYYELMVVPDDVHESMLHENWVITFNRMGDFLKRFVWNRESAAATRSDRK